MTQSRHCFKITSDLDFGFFQAQQFVKPWMSGDKNTFQYMVAWKMLKNLFRKVVKFQNNFVPMILGRPTSLLLLKTVFCKKHVDTWRFAMPFLS